MEAINNAFEGADAFRKMLEKCEYTDKPGFPVVGPNFANRSGTAESRAERREREREEAKRESRIARGLPV